MALDKVSDQILVGVSGMPERAMLTRFGTIIFPSIENLLPHKRNISAIGTEREPIRWALLQDDIWVRSEKLALETRRILPSPAISISVGVAGGKLLINQGSTVLDGEPTVIVEMRNESMAPVAISFPDLSTSLLDPTMARTSNGRLCRISTRFGFMSQVDSQVDDATNQDRNDQSDGVIVLLPHGTTSTMVLAMRPLSDVGRWDTKVEFRDVIDGWQTLLSKVARLVHPSRRMELEWSTKVVDVLLAAEDYLRTVEIADLVDQLENGLFVGSSASLVELCIAIARLQNSDGSFTDPNSDSQQARFALTKRVVEDLSWGYMAIDGGGRESSPELFNAIATTIVHACGYLERVGIKQGSNVKAIAEQLFQLASRSKNRTPPIVLNLEFKMDRNLSNAFYLAAHALGGSHKAVYALRKLANLCRDAEKVSQLEHCVLDTPELLKYWLSLSVSSKNIVYEVFPLPALVVPGENIELHGVFLPTGSLDVAIRWHGDRAALLWEFVPYQSQPRQLQRSPSGAAQLAQAEREFGTTDLSFVLRCGLDTHFSTTEISGEVLLG